MEDFSSLFCINITFLYFRGVISQRIKPKKFFFLVFLVEFQLYFTGFLQVYVTVLLLKNYLTSKIKNKTFYIYFYFFFEVSWTNLGKKIFTAWNVPNSEVYMTCFDFWKFHDDLKACLEVIRLPGWSAMQNLVSKCKFFIYVFDRLKNSFLN